MLFYAVSIFYDKRREDIKNDNLQKNDTQHQQKKMTMSSKKIQIDNTKVSVFKLLVLVRM